MSTRQKMNKSIQHQRNRNTKLSWRNSKNCMIAMDTSQGSICNRMLPFFIHPQTKIVIMELRKSSRQRAKIKMALQGPSGSGKTYGALLLAYGLCNDWTKIAVIDTENHSAE